jgi:hypothetical protein
MYFMFQTNTVLIVIVIGKMWVKLQLAFSTAISSDTEVVLVGWYASVGGSFEVQE